MAKMKVSHKAYPAWEYEREILDLNQESINGWQLVKAGCFRSKFEEDHSIVYRYQMDFDQHISNKMRYVEAFREQGWEHVSSTFNGWHFFRKKYDSNLPEEEYQIYTDMPSREELASRWSRFMIPLGVFSTVILILCILRMITAFEISRLGILLEFVVLELILINGVIGIRKAARGEMAKKSFPFGRLLALMVLGILFFTTVATLKEYSSAEINQKIGKDTGIVEDTLNVKLPDYYYVDFVGSSGAAVTFQILGEDETVIYQKNGKEFQIENEPIFLKKGTYRILISYDTTSLGQAEEKNCELSYRID